MAHSVLVTGASGFVGQSLMKLLERGDYDIVPLVRSHSGLSGKVVLDFTDKDFASKIKGIRPVDAVIHLGAKIDWKASREELFVPNVLATANLVNWAKSIGAYFIFASTVMVCGANNTLITRDTKPNPDTDYAYSKWLAEEVTKMSGVRYLILRISGVYGCDKKLGISNAIAEALQGKTPTQFGKGDIMRNYIYVDDLSRTIINCLEREVTGTHLVAGSEIISIAEMLKAICEVLLPGKKPIHRDGSHGYDQIIEHSDKLIKGRRFRDALEHIKAEVNGKSYSCAR